MTKTILLITACHPYGSGEAFIDNELPLLCGVYDVVILPLTIPPSSSVRCLPDSASVATQRTPRRTRLGQMIHGLIHFQNLKHMPSAEWRRSFTSIKNAYRILSVASRIADARKVIKRVLATTSIDLIYTYWFDIGTLAALLERESGRVSCKIITRAHRFDLYPEQQGGWIPLRDWAMGVVDAVFCIAEHGRNTLLESYPEQTERVICCPLGTIDRGMIDWPIIHEKTPRFPQLRILSLAYLRPVKRVDLLIAALSALEDALDCHLIWMHIGDGHLRTQMEELARSSLRRTEWMFAGQIDNTDIFDKIKEFAPDLLVSTSDSEGLPVSMMESLSLGVPIVARDVGGNSEIVKEGITGFLVSEPSSVESLCDAIIRWNALDDDDKLSMRISARQFWKQHFDTSTRTAAFVRELNRFLSQPDLNS